MHNKTIKYMFALLIGLIITPLARAVELDFAAVGNAQVVFTGVGGVGQPPTFSFQPSTLNDASRGFDFQVNATSGDNSATGDYGLITGLYDVVKVNDFVSEKGYTDIQQGIVTTSLGARVFIMDAGYNSNLGVNSPKNKDHEYRANITFDVITLVDDYSKSSGDAFLADGISSSLPVNVTGATYGGNQMDLIKLAQGDASAALGWSWNGRTLEQMFTAKHSINYTSLDGSIISSPSTLSSVSDGGSWTLFLFGIALLLLVIVAKTWEN